MNNDEFARHNGDGLRISVFGDESSSSAIASYGLVAFTEADLPKVSSLVQAAKTTLKATSDEPLHCKVLFHGDRRLRSAFAKATRADVDTACRNLIYAVAAMPSTFYFGRVSRADAPKVLHVPLISENEPNVVIYQKLKLELEHLQWFAYGAAATRACDTLKQPATRVLADENKSVVRWFNERTQAGRLLEHLWMDSTLPSWPKVSLANDAEHSGLQVADVLTYFATKQFADRRFADTFDLIRHKSHFMVHEFDDQVRRPYAPPPGTIVREPPRKR
jgi:hypothetical protein